MTPSEHPAASSAPQSVEPTIRSTYTANDLETLHVEGARRFGGDWIPLNREVLRIARNYRIDTSRYAAFLSDIAFQIGLERLRAVEDAHVAALTADRDRLDWIERNSARVFVVDPPSGDAWVWVCVATDDDNQPCPPEGQGDQLREAIDNARASTRSANAS